MPSKHFDARQKTSKSTAVQISRRPKIEDSGCSLNPGCGREATHSHIHLSSLMVGDIFAFSNKFVAVQRWQRSCILLRCSWGLWPRLLIPLVDYKCRRL